MVVELLTMAPSAPCASVRFVRSGVKCKVSGFATLCIVDMTESALHAARMMRAFCVYASVAALTVLAACGGSTTNPTDATPSGKLTLVFAPSGAPQATGLSLTQAKIQVDTVAVIGDLTPD